MQAGTGIAELIAQEVAKQVLLLVSKLSFQSLIIYLLPRWSWTNLGNLIILYLICMSVLVRVF